MLIKKAGKGKKKYAQIQKTKKENMLEKLQMPYF